MSHRVAAIDCGTNSIRLLVADVDRATGALSEVTRQMQIVRLGEGIDGTGRISSAALNRTFDAVDDYAAELDRHAVEKVRFVATSATRDAANREEFTAGVRQRLGVTPEVVSGDEEAALSFIGATHDIAHAELSTPYLVVDIGGGSTEFVMGDNSAISVSSSVDIGCVRMTERHFRNDPPLPSEVAEARTEIDDAIGQAAQVVPLRTTGTLVGLAGSVTTVGALALGMWEYDRDRIHHARIGAADVHRVCEDLLYSDHDKRSGHQVIHPGRVDVIAAGSLVLSAVVAYCGVAEVLVSEHDILDGIALSLD